MNILFTLAAIVNILFSIFSPIQLESNTIDCQPHYLDNYYLPGWVTNDVWYREMPQHTSGRAVWYAPGLMDSTAKVRGMNLEGFKGGIATNSVGMIGKVAWLKRQNLPWEGPYLIVDVSQRNHAYHHAVNVKTIFEVDFETAIEWGIVSYNRSAKKGYIINKWYEGDVEMWIGESAPAYEDEISSTPIVYSEWYRDNAEFCDKEPNQRWYARDWMIMDYDQYRSRLTTPRSPQAITIEGTVPSMRVDLVAIMTSVNLEKHIYLQRMANRVLFERTLAIPTAIARASTPISAVAPRQSPSEPKIIKIHTLKSHETWTHLSLRYYGYTTEPYWRLIYEANKDLVGDNYKRIWGGMEIKIPELPPNFSP